jgi:predicted PurR-regulated permease PerM
VGVNFAVLIGMFSGLANLIPYFGAFVGFILSVFVALLSGDVTQAVYAGIIVIVLQQIDGIFIQPKIVGEKVELSPVLVLLSLSVFGSMFGLPGMIFAVPLCAIFKIFLTRFMTRYKKSKLEKERELKFNQPD